MAKAWMEDKEMWLFDLAHGDLDDDSIVKGFLKHYVLQDKGISDVRQHLHFHTHYGDYYMESAMVNLCRAIGHEIDAPPRSEMRTLDEVHSIVNAVRAGLQVQEEKMKYEIRRRDKEDKNVWSTVAWADTWEWANEIAYVLSIAENSKFSVFVGEKEILSLEDAMRIK